MKKTNEIKKNKIKWFLTITSVVLSVITLISLCIGLGKLATTETLSTSDYAIGTINEDGKVVDSKQSAYTKNTYKTENMSIDIDEETATITFKVVFYDKDGKFISMTEALDEDFDTADIPSTATKFRVVVTPLAVDGQPVELNIFNLSKYTSQIKVTIKK